jgi:hypothetical protein
MLSDRNSPSDAAVSGSSYLASAANPAGAGRLMAAWMALRNTWRKLALFVELFVSRGQGYARR